MKHPYVEPRGLHEFGELGFQAFASTPASAYVTVVLISAVLNSISEGHQLIPTLNQ
jgi:hypothetical protein